MDWYPFVLFAHVGAAIVGVGANLTYLLWLRLAGRDRTRLTFAIGGIRYLDRRLTLPSYAVLFVSGMALGLSGPSSFRELWLMVAFTLFIGLTYLGIVVLAPAIRRLLDTAETDPRGDAYAREARFTRLVFLVSAGLMVAIVALMVFKPVMV